MFFSQIFANCERNSREESQDDLDLMTLVVINAKYQGKWSLRLLYLHSLGIEMDHSYTKRRIITKLGMGSVVILGVQLWIEMNSYQKNYVLIGKNWKFFHFFGKVFRTNSPPCNYWISSRVLGPKIVECESNFRVIVHSLIQIQIHIHELQWFFSKKN